MIKFSLSSHRSTQWNKFTPILWIVSGTLFMLRSFFGTANSSFVVIGLLFMIFGTVSARRNMKDL